METSNLFPSQPVCPSLGMKDDPRTSFRYPTLGNYCCYCRPPATPHLEHQAAYCIHADYGDCRVHQQPEYQPLPAQFRARVQSPARPVMRWVMVAVGILLFLFVGWQTLSWRTQAPFHWATTPPIAGPSVGPTATAQATQTFLPTPSQTSVPPSQTPIPQPTSLPVNARVLEVPIQVGEHTFLIHQVLEGENFETLEAHYDTTSEVILALNQSLSSPLWANSIIVISPGLQSVDTTMPAFRPYEVSDGEATIDELAQLLDADADLLRDYNHCLNDCQFAVGDWLIIPYLER